MQGQLAATAKQCFSTTRLSTRVKSSLASILFRRTISRLFNRNSTTPEILKQAVERNNIQPGRGVLRIVSELSANRK